jgi:hypothetical protein
MDLLTRLRGLAFALTLLGAALLDGASAQAGPPFITDDPEPVYLHH